MPSPIVDKPSLRFARRYEVAPQKVWRAWTDPQALRAWFGPGEANSVTLAQADVRVGGRFRVVFHTPDGEEHDVSGTYREVVPERRLVFTWAWKSTPERESLVTIGFDPVGTGTQMNFLHEQFYDQAARDGHEGGWSVTFEKLAHHLSTP
jgi:uncharacterized protein YndB with AHSA1/START domain